MRPGNKILSAFTCVLVVVTLNNSANATALTFDARNPGKGGVAVATRSISSETEPLALDR